MFDEKQKEEIRKLIREESKLTPPTQIFNPDVSAGALTKRETGDNPVKYIEVEDRVTCYLTASQTVPDDTDTLVEWDFPASLTDPEPSTAEDRELYDPRGLHQIIDVASGTDLKPRITVKRTGYYLVSAFIMWDSISTISILEIEVYGYDKISESYVLKEDPVIYDLKIEDLIIRASAICHLNAGENPDYAQCYVYQSSGGDLDILTYSYFQVFLLSL